MRTYLTCIGIFWLLMLAMAVATSSAQTLPLPNRIDLRIVATYEVVFPDGGRANFLSSTVAEALVAHVRRVQEDQKRQAEAAKAKPAPEPKKTEAVDLEEEILRKAEEIRERRNIGAKALKPANEAMATEFEEAN